ncbi:MAG: branched-chain amino acid ABC transporter permease [Deltaproteobacteria bacterium]|nr:branched-chain amino acid ABC transporter permease [Deltaproteobacteria bacterium]
MKKNILKTYLVPAIAVIAALLVPLFIENRYVYHLLIMACIWGIAATSMNLIMGYAGQVNLAHGAFFGIGAYAAGLLTLKLGFSFWGALPFACIIAAIFGLLVGLPALRTKGSYFAIGTLCFGVIVTVIIDRWDTLTEGQRGLMGIPSPENIPLPFGSAITFENNMVATYYLLLLFLILTVLIIYRIAGSLSGRTFKAVRENEDLAASIGISPFRTKLIAFIASTFFAGLAGALYASYIGFLSPEISDFHVTFEILIYTMIGGIGTMAGPIIGAMILPVISETLHALAAYRMVAYGILLVMVIIFFPSGIAGGIKLLRARWASSKQ